MTAERRPLNGSLGSLKADAPVGGRVRGGGGEGGMVELDEWSRRDAAGGTRQSSDLSPSVGFRRGNGVSHDPPLLFVSDRDLGGEGGWTVGARGVSGGGEESPNGRSGGGQFASDSPTDACTFRDAPRVFDYADDATSDITSVAKSVAADSDMSFPRLPPHQRVSVVFEDLEVSARNFFSQEKTVLLHGVSGQFRAGELVAVMGPSGAGKTTLLNTISGFTSGMITGGSLRLQHEDGSITKKRSAVCYLTQDDHVPPLFTVRETVMHATDLKVGSRLSRKARGLLVDDVIETLGLSGSSHTRASQLSGGQRKRLAIAAELVDNPYVIFLDEPTTGLDTSTATQCTQLMRQIARSGRAVICTIHQPSENMLSMFDQVYCLADGHCVYRGPPSGMLPFLSSVGFQCPQYHNPADFLLEVANNEYGDAVPAMIEGVQHLAYPPPLPEIKEHAVNGKANGNLGKTAEMEALISVENYHPSEWERFRILVTHNLLLQHRDWVNTHIKLFAAILIALIIGVLFGPIGDRADRVMSNISIFFIMVLYICYTPEAPAVLKYSEEIQVVKREWFNNWYRLSTYSCALLISSLPMHVMICTVLCSIAYYMTGQLAEPLRFAHFTMAVILTSIASESLGLQFGSLFLKKKIISLFIASTHLAFLIIFSGFVALKPEMPQWFHWVTQINHMHYSFNSVIIASYKDRGRVTCPEDVIYCHLRESDSVLNMFGLGDVEIWHGFLGLIIITAILRITGFITLNYNVKRVNV